jgi:hypothetical protein
MKKQFQILAATFITVAFVSCSKQNIEAPGTSATPSEELVTGSSSASKRPEQDPLTVGLDAWYTFNNNTKDVTGNWLDAKQFPLLRTGILYGSDRKGISKAALRLDGNYGVAVVDASQQTNTSISVWVKRSEISSTATIVTPNGVGPAIHQSNYAFKGMVFTPSFTPTVTSNAFIDSDWHHLVVTYDGSFVKLYVDGALQGTTFYSGTCNDAALYYRIGLTNWVYWKGYVDDLRFYSRTLSASDVQKLFNL